MEEAKKKNLTQEANHREPASNIKRIIAFVMDFTLLSFVSAFLFFYIPKLHGADTQAEFEGLTDRLAQALESTETEQSALESLMVEFSAFTAKMNYELIMTMVFIFYFLIGELFFSGKSIGKATFCLQTVPISESEPSSPGQLVMRSFIKGVSCSFFLLGIANLLFFVFNRKHRCLHDLATKTLVRSSN